MLTLEVVHSLTTSSPLTRVFSEEIHSQRLRFFFYMRNRTSLTMILKTTLLVLLATAGLVLSASGQTTVYSEDFTGQDGKGAFGSSGGGITQDTSGVNWTIDISGAGLDGDSTQNDFQVLSGVFEAQDVGGVADWFSPTIDVSGFTELTSISGDLAILAGGGANASTEGISFAYSLDGGSAFTSIYSTGFDADNTDGVTALTTSLQTFSASSIAISGDTDLQLRVRVDVNGGNDGYNFDNFSVQGTPIPEPGTYAAFAGVLALGMILRRRRKRAASPEA